MIFLRQQGAAKRSVELHPIGPKSADHPTVGRVCIACCTLFRGGDFTTLVPLGPGDDSTQQAKAREGRFYSGIAVEIHWRCATGEEQPAKDGG